MCVCATNSNISSSSTFQPLKVPSAYMLADTMLHLDHLFSKKLLKPDVANGQTSLDRACEEGVRLKRCVGGLRYLWRNSKEASHSPRVQELKDYLVESPTQLRRSNAVLDLGDGVSEDGGDDGRAPLADDEGGDGVHALAHDDSPTDASDHESLVYGDSSAGSVAGDLSSDGVDAPTLRLGDPSPDHLPSASDSDGEPRDSQRPGAWMSKMYTTHKTMGDHVPDALSSPGATEKDDSGSDHDSHDSGDDLDGEPYLVEEKGGEKGDEIAADGCGDHDKFYPELVMWLEAITCRLDLYEFLACDFDWATKNIHPIHPMVWMFLIDMYIL